MKNRRFQPAGALALCFLCLIFLSEGFGQSSFAKPPGKSQTAREVIDETDSFMRKKLVLSREILSGLVLADFEMIETAAEKIGALSQHAQWQIVRDDPVYNHFTIEFQRIAKQLSLRAKQKNLDGAAYANDHLIATCIACHKHIRDGE